MSVGGIVCEVIIRVDRVWIATRDRAHPKDRPTAIYVERTTESESVSPGDALWWQGEWAMWTPRDAAGNNVGPVEVRLKRIGFSGVTDPEITDLISDARAKGGGT